MGAVAAWDNSVVHGLIVEQEAGTHLVSRIRNEVGRRERVRVGAPDPSLTGNGGMVAVTELLDRLDVIGLLDVAVGPIKQRDRGFGAGELLVGMASAQLAGQDFLVGLDRVRADTAGQALVPVPGLASTTAAGLARRFTDEQWRAMESGVAAVTERMLALLPPRAGRGVGRRSGDDRPGHHRRGGVRPQEAGRGLQPSGAAGGPPARGHLGRDRDHPGRRPGLRGRRSPRHRRSACWSGRWPGCPRRVRRERVALRADAGYFAGQLARAAHREADHVRDRRQTHRPVVAAAVRYRRNRLARSDRHGRRAGRGRRLRAPPTGRRAPGC